MYLTDPASRVKREETLLPSWYKYFKNVLVLVFLQYHLNVMFPERSFSVMLFNIGYFMLWAAHIWFIHMRDIVGEFLLSVFRLPSALPQKQVGVMVTSIGTLQHTLSKHWGVEKYDLMTFLPFVIHFLWGFNISLALKLVSSFTVLINSRIWTLISPVCMAWANTATWLFIYLITNTWWDHLVKHTEWLSGPPTHLNNRNWG